MCFLRERNNKKHAKTMQKPKTLKTTLWKENIKRLGLPLPSRALFNVVSSTALHLNVGFKKKLGMLTHLHSAQKHCSRRMKYLGFHALNPLSVFLCSSGLIPTVYRVALQDLLVVQFWDIFIGIIIWMLRGLEYIESDLISLDSQFKLTFFNIDLSLSHG